MAKIIEVNIKRIYEIRYNIYMYNYNTIKPYKVKFFLKSLPDDLTLSIDVETKRFWWISFKNLNSYI